MFVFFMVMQDILEEFGLTNLEIKIYKMLLNHGASSVSDISQKTGIHRRNVYDCLERLIQKGLVGYMKENNTKVYSITHPKKLLDKIHQREKELNKVLPELIAKFNVVTDKKETLFFRGKEGLKQIFEDQIQTGKEVLVNATTTDVHKILRYFFPKYQVLRKEQKIHTRMIFDTSYRTKQSAMEIQKLPLCRVRYVKDFNKSPMSQYVYGDNVAIVVWSDDPIAILIRQKEIAQGFRENFELVWKMGQK